MEIDELKVICDTVVRLTEIRVKHCKHLSVSNFAQGCFSNLLDEFQRARCSKVNVGNKCAVWDGGSPVRIYDKPKDSD